MSAIIGYADVLSADQFLCVYYLHISRVVHMLEAHNGRLAYGIEFQSRCPCSPLIRPKYLCTKRLFFKTECKLSLISIMDLSTRLWIKAKLLFLQRCALFYPTMFGHSFNIQSWLVLRFIQPFVLFQNTPGLRKIFHIDSVCVGKLMKFLLVFCDIS